MKDKTIFLQNGEKMRENQLLGLPLFSIVINNLEKKVSSDVISFVGL